MTLTLYQWLTLLGFPTVIGLVIKSLKEQAKTAYEQKKESECEYRNVKEGVKALLRSEIIREYSQYIALGYAPIYARENLEDCYKQYHNLGGNGVIDDLHEKFLDLPTEGGL